MVSLAIGVGIAGVLAAGGIAGAAQAAGDTARYKGCAAHWRDTATWGECVDSPGVTLQLQSECSWSASYQGLWRTVKGSMNPTDSWECSWKAVNAFNAYRS